MLDNVYDIEQVPSSLKTLYALATLLMYIILFVNINKKKSIGEGFKTVLLLSFMIVFSLNYYISTDFFNYRTIVENPLSFYANGIIEITTFAIATFCQGDYMLFRLIIWGSAIIIFFFSTKILKLSSYLSLLIWFVFFNQIIFYGRATLAMSIFFLGVAFIIRWRKNIISLLLGAVLMVSSVFFHREMLIALALSPVLFLRIDKSNYKRILLFVAIVAIPATLIIISNPELLTQLTQNETYAERFNSYQDQIEMGVWGEQNIFGYIVLFIRHVIYYIILIIMARVFFKKSSSSDVDQYYDSMRRLFQMVFVIIIVATFFLFIFGYNAFFYRTLFISAIPISFLLCYLFNQKMIDKKTMMGLVLFSLFVYTTRLLGI